MALSKCCKTPPMVDSAESDEPPRGHLTWGRSRNARPGRWAAIAYFGDLEELKAAYKEKFAT